MPLSNPRITDLQHNFTMTPAFNTPEAFDTGLPWESGFAELGAAFQSSVCPTPLPAPYWVCHQPPLAQALGLPEPLTASRQWLEVLAGNRPLAGSPSAATVYSGHQFGVWAGQLGDGRALLIGESNGQEWQLKGAGRTPFSRMGDGRAVLRSSIREFLCSEAMHGLGVPTTRALAVVGSDAPVYREEVETAAVVTRIAPSFIRFGHFEHFCHHNQHQELRQLADYVIQRYYPQCLDKPECSSPYVAMLAEVTRRTAELMAQWQSLGFCHGVMNTDNMSILGLTLDYGPFQWLDGYDPSHICNHSDTQGRYAFYRQPNIAYWNLFCLGQALMPLIDDSDAIIAALETFKTIYPQALAKRMAAKLGSSVATAAHNALSEEILKLLAAEKTDFTIFWRRLSHWAKQADPHDHSVRDLFLDRAAIDRWLLSFSELLAHTSKGLAADLMLKTNPKYVLRNHLGELAIQSAKAKDFSRVEQLRRVLSAPFDEHPGDEALADFAPDWAQSISISCSS